MGTITTIVIVILGLSLFGMGIVRVRSNRSWLGVVIPGINYYHRTQIAGRGTSISMITSLINALLVVILLNNRYNLSGGIYSSFTTTLLVYLESLPKLIQTSSMIRVPLLLLQIWVNRGVAHRRGRGLWTGIELTLIPPVFWIVLGFSPKEEAASKYETEA